MSAAPSSLSQLSWKLTPAVEDGLGCELLISISDIYLVSTHPEIPACSAICVTPSDVYGCPSVRAVKVSSIIVDLPFAGKSSIGTSLGTVVPASSSHTSVVREKILSNVSNFPVSWK